jgi:Fe-S oxidoreductase
MAKIKAEYSAQKGGFSMRSKLFAKSSQLHEKFSKFPKLYNWGNTGWRGQLSKRILGIHHNRDLPLMQPFSFPIQNIDNSQKKVVLILDEFNHWLNGSLLEDAIILLQHLGVKVEQTLYFNTCRALISKGLVKEAKANLLSQKEKLEKLDYNLDIIGIEPSAILGFRDEFPSLFPQDQLWKTMAKKVLLIEEFLANYFSDQPELKKLFSEKNSSIHYHGHCHQKALSNNQLAMDILSFPENYSVTEIKSTCCGMAGSFGYEKEHYQLSKDIAHLALVPHLNATSENETISASGFSCQHQISDFANRKALHPVTVLRQALK